MNEAIEDEISELEELVASFTKSDEDGSNAALIAELRFEISRLKGKLYHEQQSIFMGGEVSS